MWVIGTLTDSLDRFHQGPNSKDHPAQRSRGRLDLNMPDHRDRRKQGLLDHDRQGLLALRMTDLPAHRISGHPGRNSNVLPDHYKRAHRAIVGWTARARVARTTGPA